MMNRKNNQHINNTYTFNYLMRCLFFVYMKEKGYKSYMYKIYKVDNVDSTLLFELNQICKFLDICPQYFDNSDRKFQISSQCYPILSLLKSFVASWNFNELKDEKRKELNDEKEDLNTKENLEENILKYSKTMLDIKTSLDNINIERSKNISNDDKKNY